MQRHLIVTTESLLARSVGLFHPPSYCAAIHPQACVDRGLRVYLHVEWLVSAGRVVSPRVERDSADRNDCPVGSCAQGFQVQHDVGHFALHSPLMMLMRLRLPFL